MADIMGNEFVGIGDPLFNRKYKCPKHGVIGNDIIQVSMESCPQNGLYCQRCWVENLAATCERVEAIEGGADAE